MEMEMELGEIITNIKHEVEINQQQQYYQVLVVEKLPTTTTTTSSNPTTTTTKTIHRSKLNRRKDNVKKKSKSPAPASAALKANRNSSTSSCIGTTTRRRATSTHKCDYCPKSFTRACSLNDHVRAIHSGQRPYTCPICSTSFGHRNSYGMHMKYHREGKFKKAPGRFIVACDHCPMLLSDTRAKRRHEEEAHTTNNPSIVPNEQQTSVDPEAQLQARLQELTCAKCGRMFSQGGPKAMHQATCGQPKMYRVAKVSKKPPPVHLTKEQVLDSIRHEVASRFVECRFCGYICYNVEGRKRHEMYCKGGFGLEEKEISIRATNRNQGSSSSDVKEEEDVEEEVTIIPTTTTNNDDDNDNDDNEVDPLSTTNIESIGGEESALLELEL